MQETLYQTADGEVSLSDTDAGDTLSDSGCRRLSIRLRCKRHSISQRMQEYLYQTADAGDTISASVCRSLSIRQRMQETLYQTADAEVSLSDSDCRSLSIRQRMQEKLYQTADAEVSLSDSGCRRHSIRCSRCLIECLLHPLSDRETSASAV